MFTSKRLFASVALSSVILSSSAAVFDCKLSLKSEQFDLSPLAGVHSFEVSTPTPPSVTKTTYSLSLCAPLPLASASDDECPEGTNVCMKTLTSRSGLEDRIVSVVPIAGSLGSGELEPSASLREGDKTASKGWVLGLKGGMYNGVKQSAVVEMVCEAGATETVPTLVEYDPKAGLLSLKWISVNACSTSSDAPPPPDPDTPKNPPKDTPKTDTSSGFFGWFFTLFFLSLFAYFVGGSYYNYSQYGSTGMDAIPHRDVWRDLPYVLADLFKGRGGSRNGYSALG